MEKVSGQLLWDYCEDLVEQRAGYVWGARGEVYTKQEADYLYKTYQSSTYDKKYYYETSMERWQNRIVADCSGLIQGFRRKHYDGKDATAQGLYEQCEKTGTIDTLPKNKRGVLLFNRTNGRMSHVGVYGGDNTTIESMNSKKGVVLSNPIRTASWTHWGIPSWLEVVDMKTANKPVVKEPVKNNANTNTVVKETGNLYKVTDCSWLNKRKGPGTKYEIIDAIKVGTVVTVYATNGQWAKIEKNKEVWCSLKYLKELPKYKVSNCFRLTVRNQSSTKGKAVRYLKVGDIVYCYKIAPTGWLKISEKEEYISFKYVKLI